MDGAARTTAWTAEAQEGRGVMDPSGVFRMELVRVGNRCRATMLMRRGRAQSHDCATQ